ncbi:MAG: sulfite exporter TauE/SafE family protein [Cyanobacteria bacterium P01_E01_bin.35]
MEIYGSDYLIVSSIVFLAALTQSITGFGFAIVSMSFLPGVVGLQTAVPLVALLGFTLNSIIWFYYRRNSDFKAVKRLMIASLVATPIGALMLNRFPEAIALRGLGLIIISYVVYDWLKLTLPTLKSRFWDYLAGGLSGTLSGAYAVGGPPLIVYANCRHWAGKEFKSNITPVFCSIALMATISHGWQGNLTTSVSRFAVYSLPSFSCGLWLGTTLAKKMNPLIFRQITLALLLVAGLKLLI